MTMILMIEASWIRLEMKSQKLLIILDQLQEEKNLSRLPLINGLIMKKQRLIDWRTERLLVERLLKKMERSRRWILQKRRRLLMCSKNRQNSMIKLRVRLPNRMRSTSMKRATPSGGSTRASSQRAKPRKRKRLPKSLCSPTAANLPMITILRMFSLSKYPHTRKCSRVVITLWHSHQTNETTHL